MSTAWRCVWQAWRSLTWREATWFLWFGAVLGGMNLLALADGSVGGRNPALLITETLQPLLCAAVLLLCWLPADRSDPASPRRTARLVAAVLAASMLCALLLPWLIDLLGLPRVWDVAFRDKGKPNPGWFAKSVAEMLSMLIPSALAIGVLEMAGRHRRGREAVAQALHEHATLARSALESRLAAMQAQVEPQFLFDVLVDIERHYGDATDPAAGARSAVAQMEQLITYLRVALPRLRESGSTVGAEVDLLSSYLALVKALRGGPSFEAELPEPLRQATFHPMLLLPLVQRAVRTSASPPARIGLQVDQAPGPAPARLRLSMWLSATGLCAADADLQRLHERLTGLYAGAARLDCAEDTVGGQPGTRFTLVLPT